MVTRERIYQISTQVPGFIVILSNLNASLVSTPLACNFNLRQSFVDLDKKDRGASGHEAHHLVIENKTVFGFDDKINPLSRRGQSLISYRVDKKRCHSTQISPLARPLNICSHTANN